tara:strand:- start:339 stop:467 length:129 start_codon:yes stop_codon:yes gene_type:complete
LDNFLHKLKNMPENKELMQYKKALTYGQGFQLIYQVLINQYR